MKLQFIELLPKHFTNQERGQMVIKATTIYHGIVKDNDTLANDNLSMANGILECTT